MASEEYYVFSTRSRQWRYVNRRFLAGYKEAGGQVYIALAIRRGRFRQGISNLDLELEIPLSVPVAQLYAVRNPSAPVNLRIMDDALALRYAGQIVSCRFDDESGIARLKTESVNSIMRGSIPIRTYGAGCDWALFDEQCGAIASNYLLELNIDDCTISSDTIQHSDINTIAQAAYAAGKIPQADGYWLHGFVTCGDQSILIIGHTTDTITILHPWNEFSSTKFQIYPGCDKLWTTCRDKYDNLISFSGCPFIPGKNPVTDGF